SVSGNCTGHGRGPLLHHAPGRSSAGSRQDPGGGSQERGPFQRTFTLQLCVRGIPLPGTRAALLGAVRSALSPAPCRVPSHPHRTRVSLLGAARLQRRFEEGSAALGLVFSGRSICWRLVILSLHSLAEAA